VFATNLRRLRHEKRLSHDDLPYEAEVSRSYLSQLEKGTFYASLNIVGRLAEALDVEPAELLKPPGSRADASAGGSRVTCCMLAAAWAVTSLGGRGRWPRWHTRCDHMGSADRVRPAIGGFEPIGTPLPGIDPDKAGLNPRLSTSARVKTPTK
jgi:DNA-binding XRE family transcriptional regulator